MNVLAARVAVEKWYAKSIDATLLERGKVPEKPSLEALSVASDYFRAPEDIAKDRITPYVDLKLSVFRQYEKLADPLMKVARKRSYFIEEVASAADGPISEGAIATVLKSRGTPREYMTSELLDAYVCAVADANMYEVLAGMNDESRVYQSVTQDPNALKVIRGSAFDVVMCTVERVWGSDRAQELISTHSLYEPKALK